MHVTSVKLRSCSARLDPLTVQRIGNRCVGRATGPQRIHALEGALLPFEVAVGLHAFTRTRLGFHPFACAAQLGNNTQTKYVN